MKLVRRDLSVHHHLHIPDRTLLPINNLHGTRTINHQHQLETIPETLQGIVTINRQLLEGTTAINRQHQVGPTTISHQLLLETTTINHPLPNKVEHQLTIKNREKLNIYNSYKC